MPNIKKSHSSWLREWIFEISRRNSTDGKIIFCQPCNQQISCPLPPQPILTRWSSWFFLTDNRTNFTPENLEMYLICNCEKGPGNDTITVIFLFLLRIAI
uniref:Uncharacterized protein n=1 Tax=Meloidogyne enterolobii TaxID=390850 RepID=A0A6V7WIX2_MELEN|nr:unnamed protein product [Meloidogyne enterolobii]